MNARTALPTADPVNSADIATSNLGTLRAERAIARSVTRRTWKGAVGIGVTFGVVAASSALSYVSSFPTEASRRTMAAGLSGASSFSILFGSVARIGSVGGYTAYKSFVFLTTIGAVWAILTTTRQLRGEEESGRWFLLISGRTQAVRATGATLAGIGVSLAVALALTTFITALAGARSTVGFSPWDSLVFAAASVMPAIVFAGVAAVASQLARTRRLANVIAMGCFAVLFVVRMLGDVGDSRPALLWATPMGWTELVEPLSQNSLRPFLAGATATALLVATALLLAAHRDSGDGIFATHETRPLRPLGLGSTLGLSARLTASLTLAWVIGILTTSFVFGVVTHSAVSALTSSESTSSTLTKLGAPGGGVPAFLGVIFILLGTILALVPAGLIGSARDEEASGRLTYLAAGPMDRRGWLFGRLCLGAATIVILGPFAALACWLGAVSFGAQVPFWSTIAAGINIVPAALIALAFGAMVFAFAPRAAPASVEILVGWSLVVDLLGSLVTGLAQLTRLSLFHYVTLAPAADPNWGSLIAATLLACVMAVTALAVFGRRDLAAD